MGYSRWLRQRVNAHKRTLAWWPEVARIEVEEFRVENDARLREKAIWAADKPLYNKQSPFTTDAEARMRDSQTRKPRSREYKDRQNAARRVAGKSPEEQEAIRVKRRAMKRKERERIRDDPVLLERQRALERRRWRRRTTTTQEGPTLF